MEYILDKSGVNLSESGLPQEAEQELEEAIIIVYNSQKKVG